MIECLLELVRRGCEGIQFRTGRGMISKSIKIWDKVFVIDGDGKYLEKKRPYCFTR
jgi:hypothetical protein